LNNPGHTVKPYSIQLLRRYRSVIIIVLAGIFLTSTALTIQQKYAAEQFSDRLALRAKDESAHIQQRINNIVEIMESIRNFYAASNYVDSREFNKFVKDQVMLHPEIVALEWAPLVLDADRLQIEKTLSEIIPEQHITELNADGNLVPAASRAQYFPVLYVEPLHGNELAVGYDLASHPERAAAIQQAKVTGKIAFSHKLRLVQGGSDPNAVLLFQPIYHNTDNIPIERNKLHGVAIGVIKPKALLQESIRNFSPTGLDLMLISSDDTHEPDVLHFHPSRKRNSAIAQPTLHDFMKKEHYHAPIIIPGGQWDLYFSPSPSFHAEHESQQGLLILLIGIVLTSMLVFNVARRIRYTHAILHQAQHDALTGLPNRSFFQEQLNHAISYAQRARLTSAVLFLDLDNFKHINDSLGHAVGDRLLVEVSKRLRQNTRAEDTVARMGGDEFILLVQNVQQIDDIASLAEKLLKDLTSPYQITQQVFYLSASIGISLFPRDGVNTEALIANADAAMYRAKSRGRNTYDFYSTDLTAVSMQRMQLQGELREAIKQDLLDIHYQPQIDLVSKNVIGAEALMRWPHEKDGFISPQLFIPVAEECGLIVEIGAWILRRACQQAKSWLDAGMPLQTMAVNVSGIQLQRSDFVATVQEILNETGLPAEYLELELTESVIMEQADQAIDTLLALGKLGVSLAIDDFGTGYSSLAYLKRLPLDKLKIDRSFVEELPSDEEDVAITSAIIALSNSLGLRVTAEGVETKEQNEFLKGLGCHEAQGYYFGRPVLPQDFTFTLQSR